ncbi:RolB family protein, partial [Pseudomonas aeruginosa]|uniref:RolB family protein n=1 Tax=Pseudomonas aeruginosa TaxID=287 RepID=UPI001C0ACEAD
GKRTSLLAHQTPLSRRGFSPKSVSGISRPLQLQPALDIVVSAFKLASVTEVTAQAFQLFLTELVTAAGSDG